MPSSARMASRSPSALQIETAMPFDLAGKRIWVAGHTGLVGSAFVRRLQREDCTVLTAPRG